MKEKREMEIELKREREQPGKRSKQKLVNKTKGEN